MAIDKKLIHFKTWNTFISTTGVNGNYTTPSTSATSSSPALYGQIKETSIVFIQDVQKIWTHGKLYDCSTPDLSAYLTAEDLATLNNFMTNSSVSKNGETLTVKINNSTQSLTNTWRGISDKINGTSSTISASEKAVAEAYSLAASKTSNTGTVTSVTPGTGLTNGTTENAITTSGTLNLKSAATGEIGGIKVASVGTAASGANTTVNANKFAVHVDSNGLGYVAIPQYSNNNGDITGVTAGKGLTGGATSGTATLNVGAGTGITVTDDSVSANLNDTTSLGTIGTTSKLYAVGVDANGKLAVSVPWIDTDNDTKVTSVGNHYTPAENTSAAISASGGANANITGTTGKLNVVTGIKRDAKGHIVGVTSANIYSTDNNDNTAHAHTAGTGLAISGSGGTSGTTTYSANLKDTTALTIDATAATTTSGRVYPVAVDKSGYLAVNVPWKNDDTKSFTITASASDDDVVVLSGTNGTNKVTYTASHAKTFGNTTAPYTAKYTSGNSTTSISGYGSSATIKIPQITVDEYGHVRAGADESVTITMPSAQTIPTLSGGASAETGKYVSGVTVSGHTVTVTKGTLPTIPTTLKNPNALTFGSKSYDGSSTQTITAADLGLDSALKFHGTSKTAITDGSTTQTVTLSNDTRHTAENGCVLFYGNKEFVWNGSSWEELGNEGDYKVKQTAVSSPSASGSTAAFIDTISQNTNGVITVTKKNLAAATTSVIGGLKLYNAAKTTAISPNAATTTSGRYYAVELDKDSKAFVNVPWTDTNTDTSTTYDGHYTPSANTNSELTASLSGTAGAYAKDTEYTVLTGVKAQRDAKGHVVGLTYTAQKIKDTNTDTNTHWTTRLYAGASGTAANAAADNPYLKVTDDNTYRNQVRFVGSGTVSVASDANGNITITGSAHPTSLPASDVYTWAKAPEKPTYSKSEVGLGDVQNYNLFSGTGAFKSAIAYPIVNAGVTELGHRLDLHNVENSSNDYEISLRFASSGSNTKRVIYWPNSAGTLALTSDIPTTLPNSQSISFKDVNGTKVSYTGSTAVDLTGGVYYAATSGSATSATSATSAGKLSTVSKTAWGQTYWTSGGVPTSISGDMSNVGNITMSGNIKMGDATISYDSTEKCIKFSF